LLGVEGLASESLHDATASALGFRYQERFALIELMETKDDEAAIGVETLDDVHLKSQGIDLLEQLKHSLSLNPTPLDIKSVNLWATLRIWAELLPSTDLDITQFRLVTVASIATSSSLNCLCTEGSDRTKLADELVAEAQRVVDDVLAASKKGNPKPHAKRIAGAEAFLNISESQRIGLLERVLIRPEAPAITDLEDLLATKLDTYPNAQRKTLVAKLYEWWDRQILLSLQGKRDRYIKRFELIGQLSETSAMLQTEALIESFSSKTPPAVFHTDEMLAKQCELVEAKPSMSKLARVSEWQARNQRTAWSNEAPSKHSKIVEYDEKLISEWSYLHDTACENADPKEESSMIEEGYKILKWILEEAPQKVGSIENTVTSPFYVRGSYQVLSIEGRVGWHPEYRLRLGFSK